MNDYRPMTDSELLAYIREHLMLEACPEFPGTEGRIPAMLWYLPFGRDSNNQFNQIIKMGIARIGVNSYDDDALTFFETILGKCKGTTMDNERAFHIKNAISKANNKEPKS